jgi:hypothetical protein
MRLYRRGREVVLFHPTKFSENAAAEPKSQEPEQRDKDYRQVFT